MKQSKSKVLTKEKHSLGQADLTFQAPSTLMGLAQIVAYFKDPTFHKAISRVEIHNFSKHLVSNEKSRLDSEIDRLFKSIEGFGDSGWELLAKTQLLRQRGFLTKIIHTEAKLMEEGSVIFWRFSARGAEKDLAEKHRRELELEDIKRNENSSEKDYLRVQELRAEFFNQRPNFSFGDSLFAGYIRDGMHSSDIKMGTTNFSACVFSYFDIHSHAKTMRRTGTFEGRPSESLNSNCGDYFSTLDDHELYGVKLSYEKARDLIQANRLFIPKNGISESTCFLAGEEFHPRLRLDLDLASEVVCFYKGSDPDFGAVD